MIAFSPASSRYVFIARALVLQAPVEIRNQLSGPSMSGPRVGLMEAVAFQKPAIGFRLGPSL
jgi:hypothetical protein